jgi:hypothetical protein
MSIYQNCGLSKTTCPNLVAILEFPSHRLELYPIGSSMEPLIVEAL